MPISRDEFNKLNQRHPTAEERVLVFLQTNPNSAYTAVEIALALNPQSSLDDPFATQVTAILANLLTRKAAVAKWQQTSSGPEYYFTVP
ncbi:MAG: hypothetical protein ABSA92_11645 [Candidatus Bathyarchaeia archaeon]